MTQPGAGIVPLLRSILDACTAGFPFKAGVHVNYADSVLRLKDGLPKLKDFRLELGGSGEAVPE